MCRNHILVILSVISAFALYACGKPEHDAPEQDTRKLTLSTDKVYVEWDGGVSSKVDFHQSGIEKGTRERVRSKVTKFGYHYKFLSSF